VRVRVREFREPELSHQGSLTSLEDNWPAKNLLLLPHSHTETQTQTVSQRDLDRVTTPTPHTMGAAVLPAPALLRPQEGTFRATPRVHLPTPGAPRGHPRPVLRRQLAPVPVPVPVSVSVTASAGAAAVPGVHLEPVQGQQARRCGEVLQGQQQHH